MIFNPKYLYQTWFDVKDFWPPYNCSIWCETINRKGLPRTRLLKRENVGIGHEWHFYLMDTAGRLFLAHGDLIPMAFMKLAEYSEFYGMVTHWKHTALLGKSYKASLSDRIHTPRLIHK